MECRLKLALCRIELRPVVVLNGRRCGPAGARKRLRFGPEASREQVYDLGDTRVRAVDAAAADTASEWSLDMKLTGPQLSP